MKVKPSMYKKQGVAMARFVGIALTAFLVGCAAKAPQGYGVAKSTASQAQAQFAAAEQSTQVDTASAYRSLIEQMQQAGHWYASLAHTEAYEKQHGSSPEVQLLRADALRNTQQYELARKAYVPLLRSSQGARAYRGLGLLEASQGRYDAAIGALEQARRLNPIDANSLSDMGYAYMRNGQISEAQLPIMQAAQLAPSSARVQLNLALFWLVSGEDALASQVIQKLQQPQAKSGSAAIGHAALQSLHEQVAVVKRAVQARHSAPRQQLTGSATGQVVQVSVATVEEATAVKAEVDKPSPQTKEK